MYSLAGQSFQGGYLIKEACTGPGNKLRAFWAGIAGLTLTEWGGVWVLVGLDTLAAQTLYSHGAL